MTPPISMRALCEKAQIITSAAATFKTWSADENVRVQAEKEIISRLSPSVVLQVMDALEKANKTFAYSEGAHGNDALFAIRNCLALLDGKNTEI